MHPSIPLLVISLFYTVLILILFLSKEKKKTKENKIYGGLLVTVIIGVILDICGIYCHLYLPDTSFIRWLVVKLYLAYLLIFVYLITKYVVLVSYKKEMNLTKEKETDKKVNSIEKFLKFILIMSLVLNMILTFKYYNNGNQVYLSGSNTTYVYGISALGILSWICFVVENRKNIPIKKIVPIMLFIVFCVPVILLQLSNPQILVVTSLSAFLVNFMYHTIENPDVKLNNEMKRNNEIVEQAYIDKSNFLFEMTSEVKEPLNVVRDMCKELEEENDVGNLKEGVKAINHSIRQLDFIVNNVLNVSSLDIQRIKIMKNKYSVQMLCEDLIMRVKPNISEKVEFRQKMPNSIPALYGDNIKLKQILYSLLMESARKTSKGFIEFSVNTIEKYDVCRVIFTISDSSVGMGIDKINEILSITGKLDAEDIKNLEKMEFNIELCQKLIKSLGGNLLIKSSKEKGTETIITIDQQVCREEVIEEKSQEEKRVMVVSQDKKISAKIKKIMSERNISASYVLYGMDAVDRIKSGKRYDYIIIEDDMKEVSGYVTLKELQKLEGFDIPCIVMLKENKEMIKKHYLEEGFKDYILISNFKEELTRIIDKY